MELNSIKKMLDFYCRASSCDTCPIKKSCDESGEVASWEYAPDERALEAWRILMNPEEKEKPADDAVNHPSHYCRDGAMECIDEMILLFGEEETKSYCKLNAWKYRTRAPYKGNMEQDMKKSDWYIRKYKELCEGVLYANSTPYATTKA